MSEVMGRQAPTMEHHPDVELGESDAGDFLELARLLGVPADPWQEHVIREGLAVRPDGRPRAFEVGLCVPRQNGKTRILLVLVLGFLLIRKVRYVMVSSHEMKTTDLLMAELEELFRDNPQLSPLLARVDHSKSKEAIILTNGARVRFVVRSKGSGRGFTSDILLNDEAYALDSRSMAALLPTLVTKAKGQVWYTSSPALEDGSEYLRALRSRAQRGDDATLSWMEWGADQSMDPGSAEALAAANPALGRRTTMETLGALRASMASTPTEYLREIEGRWSDGPGGGLISTGGWEAGMIPVGEESPLVEGGCAAVEVAWDRAGGCVVVCGTDTEGRTVVDATWCDTIPEVVATTMAMVVRHSLSVVVVDQGGPAAPLIQDLVREGAPVRPVGTRQVVEAAGLLVDSVAEGTVCHLGQPDLTDAVTGARRRSVGDSWALSRRGPGRAIMGVGASLALHADRSAGSQTLDDLIGGIT